MDLKEFIKDIFNSFFVIFTCAILGMAVYLHVLGAEFAALHDIAASFVISVLISLSGLVLYSKKELKKLEMLIRYAIHLFAIVGIALSVASYMEWILWSMPITVIRFMGLIAVIWVSVHAIIFFQSLKLTDDLNRKLKERYK